MKLIVSLFTLLFLIGISSNSFGQINLKDKLKKTTNSIDQRSDQGIEKSLDKAQENLGKIFKKKENQEEQHQEQPQEQQPSVEGQEYYQPESESQSPASQPKLESYSKFDFVPGERIIFYEDFSQDAIGDFPALWNTNGSAEVVTTNQFPGNWMKFVMEECIWTDELLDFPENYTIEFDVIPLGGLEGEEMSGYNFRLMQAENVKAMDWGSIPGKGGFLFQVEYFGRPSYSTWLNNEECSQQNLSGFVEREEFKEIMNQKYHISIWVQKTRLRLYQDENKIIDLPRAFPAGCVKPDRLRFDYGAAMVSNIRIAVGAPDTRNKLITEGKLVTYGIYFDVNKDVVKPESYGTLKEIAGILNEVPDVKVKITGHTDSDGNDQLNLDLSKRRAASVKAELVKSFGVNGDRLETDGMGETQPVAPNDTPSNKALNRRVEFIKL